MKKIILLCLILAGAALLWIPRGPALPPVLTFAQINNPATSSGGTVTSVGFTGGLVSVGTPTSTPALTVAGTSGGIPYFSSASTWASSGALTANGVVLGGGAGATPTVAAADSTSTDAFFATAGAPAFRAIAATDLPNKILNNQFTTTPITGTGADATMFTYTIPANTIPAGACVRVRTSFTHTTGSVSTTYKLKFGNTTVLSGASTATTAGQIEAQICNQPAVTNAQFGFGTGYTSTTMLVGSSFTTAIDTTSTVVVLASFNVAGTDVITPSGWVVELIR